MPKLADVDVRSVRFGALPKISEDSGDSGLFGEPRVPAAKAPVRKHRASAPVFPVCGILTVPYPCLVMRDGKRVFEGASIGDSVILKIDADSVTVTNSAGRFEWKP